MGDGLRQQIHSKFILFAKQIPQTPLVQIYFIHVIYNRYNKNVHLLLLLLFSTGTFIKEKNPSPTQTQTTLLCFTDSL